MSSADDMPLSGSKPDPAGGAYKVATSATTTIAAAGAAVKAAGVTAGKGAKKDVTIATSNRITMDNRSKRLMHVHFEGTLDVASGTDALNAQLFKNGALIAGATSLSVAVTAGTPLAVSIDILVELVVGDFLEIFVENEDTSANVDLSTGELTVIG